MERRSVCMVLCLVMLMPVAYSQWFNQVSAVPDNLYGVYFVNRDTGYAVGGSLNNSRILRTFNGGTDWTNVSFPQSKWMYDVAFINDSTGLVCGYNGIVYKTTDYGNSWSARPSETTEWLYAVEYMNKDTVFMAGLNGTIIRSTNGGNNWTAMSSGNHAWLLDIRFYGDSLGFACGEGGKIFRTTDTGTHWEQMTNESTNTLNALFIINPDSVFAVGNSGTILLSADSGATWNIVPGNTTAHLEAVHFTSSSHGYIVGETIILQTADGGQSWIPEVNPVVTALEAVHASPDATVAYAVGKSGTIIKKDLTTGIEELPENALKIYPNPFTDFLHLDLAALPDAPDFFSITDACGRELVRLTGEDANISIYDLSALAPGIYYLQIYAADHRLVKKLVKAY